MPLPNECTYPDSRLQASASRLLTKVFISAQDCLGDVLLGLERLHLCRVHKIILSKLSFVPLLQNADRLVRRVLLLAYDPLEVVPNDTNQRCKRERDIWGIIASGVEYNVPHCSGCCAVVFDLDLHLEYHHQHTQF